MKNDQPNTQAATPADTPVQSLSIPWWAAIATALLVVLPVLIMSLMMVVMGWFGPPMHGGKAALGFFPVLGVIPFLLAFGMMYGVYRLSQSDTT